MAILVDADRFEVWSKYMQDISDIQEPISITKADLRAVINAVDDWVESNQVSFNAALPQPGKSALTARQKAAILAYVVTKRYKVV